ncbi:MAG: hypothetical protein EOP87_00100 [Verrucomicrobiaceae bacterium]|nr:MAG: hypothetical protein EOP87_00100 [Verrucomicrobiaceae bacterium]
MNDPEKNIILRGLAAAVHCGNNPEELLTARQAVDMGSPIAAKRAARALANALAHGGLDRLTESQEAHAVAAMTTASDLDRAI